MGRSLDGWHGNGRHALPNEAVPTHQSLPRNVQSIPEEQHGSQPQDIAEAVPIVVRLLPADMDAPDANLRVLPLLPGKELPFLPRLMRLAEIPR